MNAPVIDPSLRMGSWDKGQRTRATGWRQETPARVNKRPLQTRHFLLEVGMLLALGRYALRCNCAK